MADNLSVSVTADTSELRAQLALAQADLKAFGAETRKLASDIRSGADVNGQLRSQLEQVAGQFNAAKANVTGLTSALREHKAANDNVETGYKAVGAALEGVKGSIEATLAPVAALTGGLAGVAAALGVAVVAEVVNRIKEFAAGMAELGERSLNASAALGLSVPRYAQLATALQLAGADADTAQRALERLAAAIIEATSNPASKAAVAFRNMGVSAQALAAMSKDLGVALDVLAQKFADAEEGPRRTAEMSDILSRRLLDALIPALRQGASGMEELKAKSAPAADTMARFIPLAADTKEKLNSLKQAATELSQRFFNDVKPAIDKVIDSAKWLIDRLKDMLTWFEKVGTAARNAAADIARFFGSDTTTGLSAAQAGGIEVKLPPVLVKAKRPPGTEIAGGRKGGGRGRAEKDQDEDFSGGFDQADIFAQEEQSVAALRQIDASYLEAFKADMQAMVAAHKISKEQQYGFDIEYTAQLHDQERQRLEAMLADDNATTEQKTRVYLQLLELDARYTAQVEADQAKIAEAQQASANKMAENFTQMFAQIGSTLQSTLAGMIERTTTWQQGLQKIFNLVLQDFIKMITDMVSQWAASGLMSLGIGTSAGEGAGLSAVLGAGLKGLFGTLFGGLFGEGAPAAFSAPEAIDLGTLAFAKGGIVPSAQGGWAVPSMGPGGVLAQLHSNEMVLPAGLSNFVQNAAAQAGGGGNNFSIGINAVDSSSVAKLFLSNGSSLVAALNAALRNGASLRTS